MKSQQCLRILSLLVIFSLFPVGCTSRQAQKPTRIVYGLTLAPVSGFDPHIGASSELGIPLTSVYDTLVYQDPETGAFVPGLAERWEVSDDGRTYTFYLRSDVHFHDGTPFNAEAVKVNLDRIANPETGSRKAVFLLGPYDHTEVVDEQTVRIHLKEPYAPLLDGLSQVYLGMASPAALRRWGADYQFHQVGTGPYCFVEYVPNDHLLLRRNPDYRWGPSLFARQGPPAIEEIEFRFYVDPATRALALESGEAQVMGEVPPQDAQRLEADERFRLYPVPIPGMSLQFHINTQKAPTDDRRVRQALLYATDREAIVQTVFGGTSPVAYGPLTAVTMGYDPTVRQFYPYDPDRARALLEEAGWTDTDGDGVRERDGQPLQLEAYVGSWGFLPEVTQLLQDQWQQVGIRVNARVVPFGELLEATGKGAHHLAAFFLSGSDPDLLRTFFHSEGGFNMAHVTDAEVDGWLDQAAQEQDPAARTSLYRRVQQRIMEEAWILPIRDYVNLNVADARLQGLRYDARGWFPWLVDLEWAPSASR